MASGGSLCDRGKWVFIQDQKQAWLAARVESCAESLMTVLVDGEGEARSIKADAAVHAGECVRVNVENLIDLDSFTEGSILHHVRRRFLLDNIYTLVGTILVAVNPFKRLPIYSEAAMDRFRARASTSRPKPPHVYLTADSCYNALVNTATSQSVLISGESGAGKTETVKHMLSYLARASSARVSCDRALEAEILQSNPLLEAYGNAKTLRNDNSSRFGKWMRLEFSSSKSIEGCSITSYLLEKSRIVSCFEGERNYHSFYQLLVSPVAEDREAWGIGRQTADAFACLTRGHCIAVESIDDVTCWAEQRRAMAVLRFTSKEQRHALSVVAAILHLMNCRFEGPHDSRARAINPDSSLAVAAPLLGIEAGDVLESALTTRTEQMGKGSMVTISLTAPAASDARDALAKALYAGLFSWLVGRVNKTLHASNAANPCDGLYVGVLDIFGFEVFDKKNSFEQLCINYANEKLQLRFNDVVFRAEMALYQAEGVPHTGMKFQDNSNCVALLDGKPVSLLSLLDDECATGGAARDEKYRSMCVTSFAAGKNPHFSDRATDKTYGFVIKHFAGIVEYDCRGFVEKNRDAISTTLLTLFAVNSSSSFVHSLFVEQQRGAATNPMTESEIARSKRAVRAPSRLRTLGAAFRAELQVLLNELKSTHMNFIRCVKSNEAKQPGIFDGAMCLRQLKYSGLFEAIKIRRAGYSCRFSIEKFADRYAGIVPAALRALRVGKANAHRVCSLILNDERVRAILRSTRISVLEAADSSTHISEDEPESRLCVGKTRVFLKDVTLQQEFERLRLQAAAVGVMRLQASWRGATARAQLGLHHSCRERNIENSRSQRAIILIQRNLRGFQVRHTTRDTLETLGRLRELNGQPSEAPADREATLEAALKPLLRSICSLRAYLNYAVESDTTAVIHQTKCDLSKFSSSLCSLMSGSAARTVTTAAKELWYLRLKASLEARVASATASGNERELRLALDAATALSIDTPAFRSGHVTLTSLVERREALAAVVRFLADPMSVTDDIEALLSDAARIGVDESIIVEARETYDALKPQLAKRAALRRACESVDASQLETLLTPSVGAEAWPEISAARALVRMLDFERQARSRSASRSPLSDLELELCARVEFASDEPSARADAERALRHATGDDFRAVVRAYKWRAVFCAWLYPEPHIDTFFERTFFGLHIASARQTYHAANLISGCPTPIQRTPTPPPPPADRLSPPPSAPADRTRLTPSSTLPSCVKPLEAPRHAIKSRGDYTGVDSDTLRRLAASRRARNREKSELDKVKRKLEAAARSFQQRATTWRP